MYVAGEIKQKLLHKFSEFFFYPPFNSWDNADIECVWVGGVVCKVIFVAPLRLCFGWGWVELRFWQYGSEFHQFLCMCVWGEKGRNSWIGIYWGVGPKILIKENPPPQCLRSSISAFGAYQTSMLNLFLMICNRWQLLWPCLSMHHLSWWQLVTLLWTQIKLFDKKGHTNISYS